MRKWISNRNIVGGFLFGVGLITFIDEAVFHQLLHWHHFYDKSTTSVGLISDGFFHALSWFTTVGGLFLIADLKRKKKWDFSLWMGAVLLGAGLFQFYDGTIQHKLMMLHQIRYNVDILPYDLIWNISAIAMITVGVFFINKASYDGKQKKALGIKS